MCVNNSIKPYYCDHYITIDKIADILSVTGRMLSCDVCGTPLHLNRPIFEWIIKHEIFPKEWIKHEERIMFMCEPILSNGTEEAFYKYVDILAKTDVNLGILLDFIRIKTEDEKLANKMICYISHKLNM